MDRLPQGVRLVLAVSSALAVVPTACDNPRVAPDTTTTLQLEGTITERLYPEPVVVRGAHVLVEARTPDGTGVLASDTTDGSGTYAITLEVPLACAPGDSLPAILQVTADDFEDYLNGSLSGGSREPRLACDTVLQTHDVTIHREIYRTPQPVAGAPVPVALSVGRLHTCAVTATDTWCWGVAGDQLGNATVGSNAYDPVRVLGGHTFTRVAASGLDHTCALDADGRAWCWGSGSIGQLGPGTEEGSVLPVLVSDDLRFDDVLAGRWHSCGLTADGEVYCWGLTRSLGAGLQGGTSDVHAEPIRVVLDEPATAISGSFSHTCALSAGGELRCWGFSYAGELGAEEAQGDHFTPMRVSGDRVWRSVSAGEVYTCALDADGAAWCWGRDLYGRLGTGTPAGDVGAPTPVAGGHTFATIDAGPTHACALDAAGVAWCWGRNGMGQLGVGRDVVEEQTSIPVPVATNLRFTSVGGGYGTTCGVTTDGAAVCWGWAERLGGGYLVSR